MQGNREASWWNYLLPAVSGAAFLCLAHTLAERIGWGCLILASATLAFLGALRIELAEREISGMVFLADRKGMTWIMLPFALTGSWLGGLLALALYAGGSFFWAQNQVHRTISAP
jgi:hypothetical protein